MAGWWFERFEARFASGERHPRTSSTTHAAPVTLDVYTHLFDDARHAREIRTLMTASPFAELLDSKTDPACPVLRLR